MNKMKLPLLLTVLSLSLSALSYASESSPTIGLMVKDRKTNEMIGLRCEDKDQDNICTSFQFLLLEQVSKKEISITAKIGNPVSYDSLQYLISASRSDIRHSIRDYSAINQEGIYVAESSITDVRLDDHVTSIPVALIAADNDWSLGGKIWRRTLGVVTLPLGLAVDGARYAAEALALTGEVVLKTTAYGVVGVAYDLPNSMHADSASKKIETSLRKMALKGNKNKVKKLSHKKFKLMKERIEYHAN